MTKEYYQMGWTLGSDCSNNDYYFYKDNNSYFIRENSSPIIAILSAEKIVPKLKWTKRLDDGSVIIAQDFKNGRTLTDKEMLDSRIPVILKKVHSSEKMKKIMLSQGYKKETAKSLLNNLVAVVSDELLKNNDIVRILNYLSNCIPKSDNNCYPCHADVHKNNWLLSDNNDLFLVDWEDSLLGDPAIDISFILYKYIPKENWEKWLSDYGIELTLEYSYKLKWYIILQSLILVVWYYEKKQLSEMNNWLIFINSIFESSIY